MKAKNKNARRQVQRELRADPEAEELAHKEMLSRWLGIDREAILLVKPGRLSKRTRRRSVLLLGRW